MDTSATRTSNLRKDSFLVVLPQPIQSMWNLNSMNPIPLYEANLGKIREWASKYRRQVRAWVDKQAIPSSINIATGHELWKLGMGGWCQHDVILITRSFHVRELLGTLSHMEERWWRWIRSKLSRVGAASKEVVTQANVTMESLLEQSMQVACRWLM